MGEHRWLAEIAPISEPVECSFGGVTVWSSTTTFSRWPNPEPSSHEFNCRKGRGLVTGVAGDMSCAEVEIARRFRRAGWSAGWLATCGRGNDSWREVMFAVQPPKNSVLVEPVPLLPARVAGVLARHGTSGYPDVFAWQSERHPVFVELKGPADSGNAQAAWVAAAVGAGSVAPDDFLLVYWTFV